MVRSGLQLEITVKAGAFERAISFAARPGITALVGPSGCGKTTTLNCIAGLTRPKSGHIHFEDEVWFDGKTAVNLKPQLRRLGYVLQSAALFPHLNVRDNVNFGLTAQQKQNAIARLDQLASLLGITELLDRKPSQLSGGQAQRVALARALAPEPRLLLLDEPLNALDARSRNEICARLKQVQQESSLTILFVTHFLEQSRPLADEVIELAEI